MKKKNSALKEINIHAHNILSNIIVKAIAENTSDFVGILNIHGQFIFGNNKFFKADTDKIFGMRLEEVFNCSRYDTGKYCDIAGIVIKAITTNKTTESRGQIQICIKDDPKIVNAKVKAAPVEWNEQKLILLFMEDIGSRNSDELIEQIFFHDVLNSAQNLQNIINLSTIESSVLAESKKLADINLNDIIEQIKYFQKIKSAEKDIIIVEEHREFEIQEELNRLINSISPLAVERNINLILNCSREIHIKTDLVVFRRIIINILKNAIEAEGTESKILVIATRDDSKIYISVQNSVEMPEFVKAGIFQRSFSTKGEGRGIGTYGIQLLVESYLSGKISFCSSEEIGTVFMLEIPYHLPNNNRSQSIL